MLGKVASAIGEAGGTIGAVDLVQVEGAHTVRDITVETADADDWPRLARGGQRGRRRPRARRHRPDVHAARRRQDRDAQQEPAEDARRPLDGLHARRRAGLQRDLRGIPTRRSSTRSSATRSRRLRRDRGARARRHRPAGGDAGDGGQGDAVQGVRRRRRLPDLPRHARSRRDRRRSSARSRPASAESTWRTSPRRAASRSRTGCKELLDIPVFHDDQHGTAVVVLAALLNALKLTGRPIARPADRDLRPGRGGRRGHPDPAGGRGAATSSAATRAVRSTSSAPDYLDGIDAAGRSGRSREATNPERRPGALADVLDGADLFIGLSGGADLLGRQDLGAMAPRPDRVRDGQPGPRGRARGCRRRTRGSSRPAARTTRTRSTTCSASPASSAARWTSARPRSPRR